jgi:hypothetical protein
MDIYILIAMAIGAVAVGVSATVIIGILISDRLALAAALTRPTPACKEGPH